ncbi:LysR substrate-binding domain-containing protein [Paucibacter sp. JuS9]|uniref:LysR family transcriptional regulator n=1 Tax=Paucibacter sp. JuS9 TaxID=3228748 RepID=UPI003756F6D5
MAYDALNPLEVLLQLQQCGSLAQAASRLHRSASALSKIIRGLEQEVGQTLVEHASRPLRLTDAGRIFAEVARQNRDRLRDAQDQIGDLTGRVSGRLRVTASVLLGHAVLAEYVVRFRARHPEVEVEIELSDADLDPIRSDFDLALRHEQGAALGLIGRALGSNRVHVVGTSAYFKRHGRPTRPADLARHACLSYRCSPLDSRWSFHCGSESHCVAPRGPVVANSDEVLLASMRAGHGLLPCFDWLVGRELQDGSLESCLDDWRFESEAYGAPELWAVYPESLRGRRKLKLFIDGLIEYLEERRGQRSLKAA